MDVASGIIRTDTGARSNTLWGMGTQKVYDESDRLKERTGPSYSSEYDYLRHAKYELAGGVALLMEQHSEAADELRSVALQFIEAVQRAGPPKPHPVMWGTLVAFVGLLITVIGGAMKFSSEYGELHQQVAQLQAQVSRMPEIERRVESVNVLAQEMRDMHEELRRFEEDMKARR